jgi:nucleotide-binding universal stress UspA family protein
MVAWAAAWARQFDARLLLLHVLQAGAAGDVAIRRTHAVVRQVYHHVVRAPFTGRTTVAVGQSGAVLLEHARAIRADIIVLGRTGKHAAGPTELGTTTRLLLRAAQVPVAIIPPGLPQPGALAPVGSISQGVNACL